MKTSAILLLLFTAVLTSCGGKDKSALKFRDAKTEALEAAIAKTAKQLANEEAKKKILAEKNLVWEEINTEARESYKNIKDLVENKCTNCHDANFKLPFYGRIAKGINPVHKHQVDGLASWDFSGGFPFKAKGNPPTIALLKSIKNAFIERTMPIKSFTIVYPGKKISDNDEKRIIDWVDPIIEKLEDFDKRFNPKSTDVATRAVKILELKCYRCHAVGNEKGKFGDMEKTAELIKGKFIDLERPDQSILYTQIFQGKMPPSKLEALDMDEMNTIRDWLELEAKKIIKK